MSDHASSARRRSRRSRSAASPTDDRAEMDDTPALLDAQSQQDVIAALAERNAARDGRTRQLLLALPGLAAGPCLVVAATGATTRLLALLGLTSLAVTGWLLATQPPGLTGLGWLDRWSGVRRVEWAKARGKGKGKGKVLGGESLLQTYLPYLNVGLSVVLVVMVSVSPARAADDATSWTGIVLGVLPALVFSVVLSAKVMMGSVDPERELSGLRYEYKGA